MNTPSFAVISKFKKMAWVPECSAFVCNSGG